MVQEVTIFLIQPANFGLQREIRSPASYVQSKYCKQGVEVR